MSVRNEVQQGCIVEHSPPRVFSVITLTLIVRRWHITSRQQFAVQYCGGQVAHDVLHYTAMALFRPMYTKVAGPGVLHNLHITGTLCMQIYEVKSASAKMK